MSKIFRTFIAENQSLEFSYAEAKIRRQSLEFSYAEAKIRRQTHRKGTRRAQVYCLQR